MEPQKTGIAVIADLPSLQDIFYHDYDADDECDESLELGDSEGKSPFSLNQTEFSLKQFAKWMGQANYSVFNK